MKTLILVFSIFVLNISAYSQVYPLLPRFYQPLDSSVLVKNKADENPQSNTLLKQHEKLTYSVALGTGFSSFGDNMSMMNTYIAPTINYQVNSKLNIVLNGVIMQNNFNGLENLNTFTPTNSYNTSTSNYGISGMAYYQISEKWSVWGDGAYFDNQSVFNDYRAEVYDNDYKTISVGVGYKINDKFQFNFQYRYSNGLNPAFNGLSPFHNSFYNPYNTPYGMWDY